MLCILLAGGVGNGNAIAQTVDSTLWCLGPGDRVFATARAGNTIYLGGNFATVGPASGGGVPIEVGAAAPGSGYPRVAGEVDAVIPDGRGGWYVGGLFKAVGGRVHENLAHISSNGVDEAWITGTSDRVCALALSGDLLYVGGDFYSVGSAPRRHLAAIDITNGMPTTWDPDPDWRVSALVLADSIVFAGGMFTEVGGAPHPYVAAIDIRTAAPTPWNPGVTADVNTLLLQDSTLFIGGWFSYVGDTLRPMLVAVSTTTAELRPWDPAVQRKPEVPYDGGPRVSALLLRDSTLFVAGSFKSIGGQPRQGLAALNIRTAEATAWDPQTSGYSLFGAYYRALALSGDTLFVAGEAISIGGQPSSYLAAVSARSAVRLSWDPNPNAEVFTLATGPGTLYAGGVFTSMGGWVRRHNLAAVNAATGGVMPWDPSPDYYVSTIAYDHGTVYVGGIFSMVGGQPRDGVAAIDGRTGTATSWNPGVMGGVKVLTLFRGTVLVGGSFGSVGGVPRANLAAIDIATGLPTSWDPRANDVVTAIIPTDTVIYVGGWFSAVGGQVRGSLAAIDPESGFVTPWAPSTDGIVNAMGLLHGRLFVGGIFNSVNGAQRYNLAALDDAGIVAPWAANANARILALVTSGNTVYVGGEFSEVGGQSRSCIAALDAKTGEVLDWYPAPNGPEGFIWSLSSDEATVYAGGAFTVMGNWPQACLAAITSADAPVALPLPDALVVQSTPNPARGGTLIRYSLPTNQNVRLTVFDLQGRSIANLISGAFQTAGPHEVPVSTAGWRPGCYPYRLEAGGLTATKKLIVLR